MSTASIDKPPGHALLGGLEPAFRDTVAVVLERLRLDDGHEFRPYCGHRSVVAQAILWRQSRATAEIRAAVARLERAGAPYLASVLDGVGPRYGRWATNALPGQSWHNWRNAVDVVLIVDGAAVWDADHPGYDALARACRVHGLESGHNWRSRDSVHVQAAVGRSPSDAWGWPEIDEAMRRMTVDRAAPV